MKDIDRSLFNVSNVEFIKLETCKDSCLIGKVHKIEYFRNHYYIFDKYYSKSLFIFNDSGKFVFKTRLGKGPGEVIDPLGFFIDTIESKNINVLLFNNFQATKFDLTGNYLGDISVPGLPVYDLTRVDNNKLLAWTQYPTRREIIRCEKKGDKNLELVDVTYSLLSNDFKEEYLTFFPFPARSDQNAITLKRGMSNYKSNIKCLVPLDNIIYSFNGTGMKAKYIIDFGSLSINNIDKSRGLEYIDLAIKEGKKAGRFDNLIETDQFIIFSYYFGKEDSSFRTKNLYGIYSKKEKRAAVLSDLLKLNGLPLNIAPMNCIGNKLLCVLDGDELEGMDFKKFKIEAQINNNPVIFILTISL